MEGRLLALASKVERWHLYSEQAHRTHLFFFCYWVAMFIILIPILMANSHRYARCMKPEDSTENAT